MISISTFGYYQRSLHLASAFTGRDREKCVSIPRLVPNEYWFMQEGERAGGEKSGIASMDESSCHMQILSCKKEES